MKLPMTLIFGLGLVALAIFSVTASPTAATTTTLAVREPGHVGEHIDPRDLVKRFHLGFTALALTSWGYSAYVCSPPGIVAGIAWPCIISVVFSLGATIAGFFSGSNQRHAADVHFQSLHIHHYPAVDGMSTLHQLATVYEGNEPILAISCNSPGSAGCYNVYYSNRLHNDGASTIHSLRAKGVSQRQSKRLVITETAGVDADGPGDAIDVWGRYDFSESDKSTEQEMGMDKDFAMQLAQGVEDAAAAASDVFRGKGAWCMNLGAFQAGVSGPVSKATVGFLVVDDKDNSPIPEDEWISKCDAVGPARTDK